MGFDLNAFSAQRDKERKKKAQTSSSIVDIGSIESELSSLREQRLKEEQKALDAKLSPRERKLKAQEKRLNENYGSTSGYFKAASAEQAALQNAGGKLTSLDQIAKDSTGYSFADYEELLNYNTWLSDTDRRAIYNLNKDRSAAIQKEVDALTKKAKTAWAKLSYNEKSALIDKNRAAEGKEVVSFTESLALSDKDKQTLAYLLDTKTTLDRANATYDKHGNAAGLTNEEIDKLKDEAYAKGDTEGYFYYENLKGKKEVWDNLNKLYTTKASGKDVSLADEAVEISQMEDGDERTKRLESLEKEFKKLGIDFKTYFSMLVGEEAGLEFFKESEGNALEATGATAADVAMSVGRGAGSFGEGVLDFVGHGIANAADLFGADEFAGKTRIVASTDYVRNWLTSDTIERYSVLGRTSRNILEGVGQVAAMVGVSALGGAAFGTASPAASAFTTATMGASSVGLGTGEAFQSGATKEEAITYGLASGVTETLSEMLFQGLGKGFNVKGISSLDDIVASKVSSVFKKPALKNVVQYAVKSGAEGVEEILAGFGGAVAKKMTYMSEEDVGKILDDEGLLESFIVGTLTSSIAQAPDAIKSTAKGRDFVSGLTTTEQKAIDEILKKRVAEAEKDGKKLDPKEKAKMYDDLIEEMDNGKISIGEIEDALGGETKKKLNELSEKEAKEKAELAEHYKGEDLKKRLEAYDSDSKKKELEAQLSDEVYNLVANTRLSETYNEQARKAVNFSISEEELAKIDEKRRPAYVRAMEEGRLNNTRAAHEILDLTSKIEADKGIRIDLTDTEALNKLGYTMKDVVVNGVATADGISVNIKSPKVLNTVVGHELVHVLKGDPKQFESLKKIAFELAKTRGEYDSRWEAVDRLYKDKKGYQGDVAKINEELLADLVGDYLFTDKEFVRSLSVKDRNLFQRIFDEIKYLLKLATAGSAEARQLEKLKKTFEDAYRAETKGVTETKYSISDPKTDSDGKQLTEGQREYFNESKIRDEDGRLQVMYHGTRESFSVFDRKKARSSGIYGSGFYFTNSKSHASTYGNRFEVYLNITNPVKHGTNNITKEQLRNFVEELANNEDYGIDNYGYGATVDGVVNDVYGKDDFSMLLDLNVSCVGNMVEAVELFNKVNGTTYDGIVAPTETIAFYPEQIKSVDNKNPTKNPDVHYSLSENGATPKKYGNLNISGEDVRYSQQEEIFPATEAEAVPKPENVDDISPVAEAAQTPKADATASKTESIKNRIESLHEQRLDAIKRAEELYRKKDKTKEETDEMERFYSEVSVLAEKILDAEIEASPGVLHLKQSGENGWGKLYFGSSLDVVSAAIRVVDKDLSEAFKQEINKDISYTQPVKIPRGSTPIFDAIRAVGEDVRQEVISPMQAAKLLSDEWRRGGVDALRRMVQGNDGNLYEHYLKKAKNEAWGTEATDLPDYAESQIEHYKNAVADERANLKTPPRLTNSAIKGLINRKTKNKAHTGAKVVDGKQYLTNGIFVVELNKPDSTVIENEALAVDSLKNVMERANKDAIAGEYKIDATDIALISKQVPKGKNQFSYVVVGNDWYNLRYVDAVMKAIENPTVTQSKYNEEMAFLVVSGDNGQAVVSPVRHGLNAENEYHFVYRADKVGSTADISPVANPVQTEAESRPSSEEMSAKADALFEEWKSLRSVKNRTEAQNLRLAELSEQISYLDKAAKNPANATKTGDVLADDIAPLNVEEQAAMARERLASLTDSDMPPIPEAPYYEAPTRTGTPSNPFTGRDYDEVGNRGTKSFMEENPETIPYFQEAAQEMLGDLQNSIKGERYTINDADGYIVGWDGTKRNTTDDIADLLDGRYHYSYKEISDALNAIINGEKLNACAKRVEFALNDRLMNGYTNVDGRPIPANQEYIDLMRFRQETDEAYKQYMDSVEYIDDSFAPVAENPAPVESVKKTVDTPVQNATSPIADAPMVQSENKVTEANEHILNRDYNTKVKVLSTIIKTNKISIKEATKANREISWIGKPIEQMKEENKIFSALLENKDALRNLSMKDFDALMKKYGLFGWEAVARSGNANILTEEPESVTEERSMWQYFMRNFVDKKSVFEKLSLKTGNRELQARADALHRADSSAQYLMKNGDKAAGVKSLDEIRKTVQDSGKEQAFSEYVYHVHNIDRMSLESRVAPRIAELKQTLKGLTDEQIQELAKKSVKEKTPADEAAKIKAAKELAYLSNVKNKPVFGEYTAEDSRGFVAEFERNNPEFKEWAQDLYDYSNYLRDMMIENGIISQETADLWQSLYPHYVPIRRDGKNGAAINVALDTNKTGINAPIKRATGGNSDILPLFDTLGARTVQTFNAIAKNRFGVELKNTLNTNVLEDSKPIMLDDATEGVENHEGWLQDGKDGMNPTFTVFEDGKRVTFEISEDMFDAMKPTSEFLSKKVLKGIPNKISNFRRGLLTEYNLLFAATNAAKDFQDILTNSQHPYATYKAIPEALIEILTKGKYYQERMAHGGDQDTLFDRDTNTFAKEKSKLRKFVGFPLDKISGLNNFIEQLPRLAEYIASRKAGRSIDVSMLDAARVTTNFAAGGDVTKFANRNGFTFLNASVQGAAQQVRNIREAKHNGIKGWVGLATKFAIAGLPAFLLNGLLWEDDEDFDELSDYVKRDYYIVGKNSDGTFVRIPKGRAVSVIQNGLLQMQNLITGNDEVDFGAFCDLVLNNLAPSNPAENNIISPIIDVLQNETWYGEEMIPSRLKDEPASEQFDESVDSISKWLGEKTGISPYKINYLLDQYSGVVGDFILPNLTPDAERGDGNIFTAPILDKFTTDPVMKNQNVSDFYTLKDELTVNANASEATAEDILKSKYMNSVNSELSELYAQKREIQNDATLSDEEKYAEVRALQQQIVDLTRDAMDSYKDIEIDDYYARVGNRHYRLDNGTWTKISDTQLERMNEVTSKLGISPSEYWSKTEISFMPKSDGEYEYAYESPEKYEIAKVVGYDAFREHSTALNKIPADKDANGKPIRGSREEKVISYINGLNIPEIEKVILYKSQYPSDNFYNNAIVTYLNNRNDISSADKQKILVALGIVKKSNNAISW